MKKDIRQLYNKEDWIRWHKNTTLPQRVNLKAYPFMKLDFLFKKYLPKGNYRFLEVGAAPGRYSIYFHEHFGYKAHCIDYSKVGCELIRKNLEMAGVKGKVYDQDILDNDLKSESFDVIFSAGLIEHFDDPAPIISELGHLLKKNGYIVTTIPNQNGLIGFLQRLVNKKIMETLVPHTLESIKRIHKDFEIIYSSYFGSFFLGVVDWGPLKTFMGYIAYKASAAIWYILKMIPINIDSKYISPYIVVIAKKKSSPNGFTYVPE